MTATLTAQAMTPDEAAWVRQHVFTPQMRDEYGFAPHRFTSCPCFTAAYPVCTGGGHDRCPFTNGATVETYLYLPSELVPDQDGARFTKPTPVRRVGRPCRNRCGCNCHSKKSRKAALAAKPATLAAPRTWSPLPAKAGKGQQLSFF